MTLAVERSSPRLADPFAGDLAAAVRKIAQLEVALASSRVIGVALGIIVERCKVSSEDAFDLLVQISQHDHRKLRDVAEELVRTGRVEQAL